MYTGLGKILVSIQSSSVNGDMSFYVTNHFSTSSPGQSRCGSLKRFAINHFAKRSLRSIGSNACRDIPVSTAPSEGHEKGTRPGGGEALYALPRTNNGRGRSRGGDGPPQCTAHNAVDSLLCFGGCDFFVKECFRPF